MLTKMGLGPQADRIHKAVLKTYAEGKHMTGDLGGKSTTSDFTKAVIGNLE